MKTLQEILGSKKKVVIDFQDILMDEASDGSPIFHFILKETIPTVFGGQIRDLVNGGTVTNQANDVERVSIGNDAINKLYAREDEIAAAIAEGKTDVKPQFTWEVEGKSGKLECDLIMDVSRNGEVWITTEKFSAFGRKRRTAQREAQNSALVKKIQDAKTKKAFEGVNVNDKTPSSVAGS